MKKNRKNKKWHKVSSLSKLIRCFTLIGAFLTLFVLQLSANGYMSEIEAVKIENKVLNPEQQQTVSGKVTDTNGEVLPGVTVMVKGTNKGTITDENGNYTIADVPINSTLQFSFVGMQTHEIEVGNRTVINLEMEVDTVGLDEVVVIGYGSVRKSDLTGSVASVQQERLENLPNINIGQAMQGATSGLMVQTTSATAKPSESFMLRGRNSITASNSPLVVIDGIPGNIWDVNPNDVASIEILKDASASAIYGSRSANGVILITSKKGTGKTKVEYDGSFSIQELSNLPNYMNGEEFYHYKMERVPSDMTVSEEAIYEAGAWINWQDVTMRTGSTQQHRVSVSGSNNNTNFYISGSFMDIKGIKLNDNYSRISGRINLDTKITDWFSIGTRSSIIHDDESGVSPEEPLGDHDGRALNPLTTAYDENGKPTIYPWPEDTYFGNPLSLTLYDNKDLSYKIITNNFATIDFPFLEGLSYRLNTGISLDFLDRAEYAGRDTKVGLENGGRAITRTSRANNITIENIFNYKKEVGLHEVFATALYSYEDYSYNYNSMNARHFPHDFLSWYASNEAESKSLGYGYNKRTVISQMARLNYIYNRRYLLTLTGRRDGYSGFGEKNKWGFFPSAALGWNITEETFFPYKELFDQLKLRVSWGKNGNQGVEPFNTIAKLSNRNNIDDAKLITGYFPSSLSQNELGWETSETVNIGLDFAIKRISGDINFYLTKTADLLLNRKISPVHGITEITDNIGETQNKGVELSITSRNIQSKNFSWTTSGNFAYMKNKIVSLYGLLDEDGNELDDVSSRWFIGEPIAVTYGRVWNGVWQLDEAEEAAKWGSKPGYVKIKDLDNDGRMTSEDLTIIGQKDPKVIWGMNNSFTYKNLTLNVFVHGVHGVTFFNNLWDESDDAKRNVLNFNFWTPDNPTNDWIANDPDARRQAGVEAKKFEKADFVRLKDISLVYNLPKTMTNKIGIENLKLYVTGRNLFTFTEWTGLDPELARNQQSTPLQKTYLFGLQFTL